MAPPIRTEDDRKALIEGLKDGTIDAIMTDHAPHCNEEKDVPFNCAPNGIAGLETSLASTLTVLYHENGFTLDRIVELMSVNPANCWASPAVSWKKGLRRILRSSTRTKNGQFTAKTSIQSLSSPPMKTSPLKARLSSQWWMGKSL